MSLDSRLRDVLHDNRFELPGWDDPVGRVRRGIGRRRRRRMMLGGAIAALLIAIPAVLAQHPFEDSPGIDSPIPFVDSEALAAPTHIARRSPRPEAKPCERMGDEPWLRQDWLRPGVTTVMLTAAAAPSLQRCTLHDNGGTTLTATNKTTGLREVFTAGSATPPGAWQAPATIDPGEPARLDIVAGKGCGQPFDDFTLAVQDRVYDLGLTTECPPTVTQWYVEPPLLNAPLTVTMKAPATVQRGQWFEYVVTVLNAFNRPYKLVDCPVYLQRIGTQAIWRRLNCDRLRSFPAHKPVQFTMRAYVPADQPAGITQLSWMAVMADGEVAIAEISTDGVKVEVV